MVASQGCMILCVNDTLAQFGGYQLNTDMHEFIRPIPLLNFRSGTASFVCYSIAKVRLYWSCFQVSQHLCTLLMTFLLYVNCIAKYLNIRGVRMCIL